MKPIANASMVFRFALIAFALAWTLFAFAGYYRWTQWPAAAAIA